MSCHNMFKIQLHLKATQKSFFLRQSHLVSKMLWNCIAMLTREITRFFIRSKWKNFELFPFLEKNLIMKRETTPDNFFNILFISAFLGGMGVYQYNFLHWFYHVYYFWYVLFRESLDPQKRFFLCEFFFQFLSYNYHSL